jgi:hypothetical protein
MQLDRPAHLFVISALLLAVALTGCGPAADGEPCDYQSDCENACIMEEGDPTGEGVCGPYRELGESCTRPGYALDDCEPGLDCSRESVCVQDGGGASECGGRCTSDQYCIISFGECRDKCRFDTDCATGCCAPLEGGGSACLDDRYCDDSGGGGGGGDQCNCASDEICVNTDGVPGCYPTCTSNSQCASGCCSTVDGAAGNACAPDSSYCEADACGGCGLNERCIESSEGLTCEPFCTSDADCSTCCVSTTDGADQICAPNNTYCSGDDGGGGGGGNGHQCTDLDQCLSVVDSLWGAHCGNSNSLDVTVRNGCNQNVLTQICLERTDGTWSCGLWEVGPGNEMDFYTCEGTGSYLVTGRSPDDFGEGCFPDPGS